MSASPVRLPKPSVLFGIPNVGAVIRMRTLPASSVLVPLSSGASATINPPLVPPSGVVDHVVTAVDTIAGRRAPWDGVRRLTHHAGWTRIEWVQEGRSKVRGFAGPGTTVLLSLPCDVRIDVPPNMLMTTGPASTSRWRSRRASAPSSAGRGTASC